MIGSAATAKGGRAAGDQQREAPLDEALASVALSSRLSSAYLSLMEPSPRAARGPAAWQQGTSPPFGSKCQAPRGSRG